MIVTRIYSFRDQGNIVSLGQVSITWDDAHSSGAWLARVVEAIGLAWREQGILSAADELTLDETVGTDGHWAVTVCAHDPAATHPMFGHVLVITEVGAAPTATTTTAAAVDNINKYHDHRGPAGPAPDVTVVTAGGVIQP